MVADTMESVIHLAQQHQSQPFIHDIEAGNGNYQNDTLPHEKFGVQVSESNNDSPLNVIEEMSRPYVQACRNVFAEDDVKNGIRYLNTLGGI
jgi:hypothetical protein